MRRWLAKHKRGGRVQCVVFDGRSARFPPSPSLSQRQQQLLDEVPRSAVRYWLKVAALPRRCAGTAHCLRHPL
ncbi:hypothetical protein NHX12_031568 [Muraenolepis orangiensis]|uniref:Uncharacterized protein n=1 Tax=Muraenolepis orangiensis TaxID=630683 RepID=A0A9Q0E7Q5_9TELE|nr:hypothetical protein NHX12_031568 [Muraenolepis orangiensis]